MGLPSSETATMPASFMAAISARASPSLATLAAPMGHTWTLAATFARSRMKRVTLALSLTGLVLGMQQTAVNPPRAAASVPVAMVSEDSWPGSRRCACRSMKPGATINPVASKISGDLPCESFPGCATSTILSPSRRTSRGASVCVAGSRTRPFLTRSMRGFLGLILRCGDVAFFRGPRGEQEKQRHSNGNAIGDLLEDAGLRSIGDFGSDLHATIHGTGVKNDGVGPGMAESFGVELIEKNIVPGGKCGLVEAFGLDAEDENDIGIFESFLDAEDAANGGTGRADAFKLARDPHRGAAEREAATEFCEQVNVGASDAAMRDVAEDGDVQIFERAFAIANGEGVEQALGRMLVSSIAGIDHGDI